MKTPKLPFLFIFFFSILSCTDKKEPIESNPLPETDSTAYETPDKTLSFEESPVMQDWLNFYRQENPGMGMADFELEKTQKLETIPGTVNGNFDPEFDTVYEPFLVYNPSKTLYIDLDSYHWSLDKDGNALFEADQEINLINLNNQTVERIGFYGPSYRVEDAFWLTDSVFVLLEKSDGDEAGFRLFNLQENTVTDYVNTQPLKTGEQSYHDFRLSKKGVEILP